MNLRYFILTMALVPSIAYTAEITKKEDRTLKHQVSTSQHRKNSLEKRESSSKPLKKHPKKESATLLDKPKSSLPRESVSTAATHIVSLTQLITFNGYKLSLYKLIDDRENNKFGLTRVIEAHYQAAIFTDNRTFTDKGTVSLAKDADKLKKMIAEQKAFYISNIEEKESIQYGAIVCKDDLNNPPSQIAEDITTTTNFFLFWLIDQRSKELKKLEDEKIDKKKEELQDTKKMDLQSKKSKKTADKKKEELESSKAEMLADAVKELKSSV